MKRALRTVVLAAWLAGGAAQAEPLQQLRDFLSHTTSARGAFAQTVSSNTGARSVQASSGHFEFARPGRFRWIYDKPYPQTIVSDGDKLYVYDPDLKQVTVKGLKGSIPASPASILFGSNDFERDFQVKGDGVRDGVEWILAVPRSQDSTFDRIRIGFRDSMPVAMELADTFGQTTELRLERLQRNPSIDAALFRFEPPKGVDVLQER